MHRGRDEHGYTLVELVAAIAILGVVTVGLAATVGTSARVAGGAQDRMAGASAARLLTTRLPADVQGATEAVAAPTGDGIGCAGVTAARLSLTESDGTEVVYGIRQHQDDWVLERHTCVAGASTTAVVVARHLAGPDAVVPARVPAVGAFRGASLTIVTDESDGPDRSVTVAGTRRTS